MNRTDDLREQRRRAYPVPVEAIHERWGDFAVIDGNLYAVEVEEHVLVDRGHTTRCRCLRLLEPS